MVDALATLSILLVVNNKGSCCCLEEPLQWGSVGDDVLSLSEDDILDPELCGPSLLICARVGVFPHSQQVVESNVGEVTDCLLLGVG